ncbi:MAG: tetratricopeptide repeat protein [Alphaproteobacteria bacterium]|nr:tetratricopeptide repeat protein [Alphaproteobacteria bacterium]
MTIGAESTSAPNVPQTVQQVLAQGLAHHRAGRFAEAQALYQQAMSAEPGNADALHLAGMLARDVGQSEMAARLIGAAIQRNAQRFEFHNNLGNALRDLCRFPEAIAAFEAALKLAPDHAPVLANFAAALEATSAPGHLDRADELAARAVRLAPELADAHYVLGMVRLRQGDRRAALSAFEAAARLAPDYAEAHYNRGTQHLELGDTGQAVAAFTRALELRPAYIDARCNLATALIAQGKLVQAIDHATQAVRLASGHAGAHCVMGNALFAAMRAVEAMRAYETACRLDPAHREAHFNLANAAQDAGDTPRALGLYWHALAIAPDFPEGWKGLGLSYRDQGQLSEASGAFDRARALKPDPGLAVLTALMVPRIPASDQAITDSRTALVAALDRLDAQGLTIDDAHREVGAANFYLAYQARDDRALNERIARFYRRACPALNEVAPHCRAWQPVTGRRVRVGFISELLRVHTIGKLTHGIIRNMDRARFETVVLRKQSSEDRRKSADDEIAGAVDRAADRVVELDPLIATARRQIAAQELDVLFYLDIGMTPMTYFLAFARLAPVQCVTWGHPVTTGLDTVDYYLSSEHLEPPGTQAFYTEKLVRLPRLPTYYIRPTLPARPASRADLGLPADRRLYVCPQSLFKLHPQLDPLLGEVLRRDPQGLLVLIESKHGLWTREWRQRFAASQRGAGLADVAERVQFLPFLNPDRFASLLLLADAVLDPVGFGGGNSTYETLAFGAPIVTWPGAHMRARVTVGCYNQIGVTDLVATDAESYVSLALRLAQDKEWHAGLSRRILARSSALFEDEAAVRALEDFFHRAATGQAIAT